MTDTIRSNALKKWRPSLYLKIILCVFWLFAIILPLVRMLSTMATVDVAAVLSTRKFSRALRQSITVSCVAMLISVTLAGLLSWAVARTNIQHNTILNTLLTVPMLIPSISHGMGLIIILGANGWLSKIIGIKSGIYGFSVLVCDGKLQVVGFLSVARGALSADAGQMLSAVINYPVRVGHDVGRTVHGKCHCSSIS